jgi:phage/conjugal plasmid C-4 type zinc finger TraR family protein
MNRDEHFEYNNEEEAEIAQINSLVMNMNAERALRDKLEKQRSQPSAEFCEGCGDEIPEPRRLAIPGVTHCVYCQDRNERLSKLTAK